MSTPIISIIVPVYNTGSKIEQSIESILRQSFKDFELLLIDDGSKDESGAICDEYAKIDNRIRVFHKENEGVSSARNTGLEQAFGEWIAFVDSDDRVEPGFLSSYHECLHSVPETDMVIQGYMVNNGEQTKWPQETTDPAHALEKLFQSGMRGAVWNKLFKKSQIEAWGTRFMNSLRFLEDECFVLSYLRKCKKITFSPDCGYYYNEPENWGRKYNTQDYYARYQCYRMACDIPNVDDNLIIDYLDRLLEAMTDTINQKGIDIRTMKGLLSINRSHAKLVTSRSGKLLVYAPSWFSYRIIRIINFFRKMRRA